MQRFGERIEGIEYLPKVGSYAVILEENRIGVIKSKVLDKYFLVGGAIEKGETETEALQREAIEEIGFEIEIGEKLESAVEYFYAGIDKCHIAKECNFYRVSVIKEINKLAETKLLWIKRDKLNEIYHQSHQWIIKKQLNLI